MPHIPIGNATLVRIAARGIEVFHRHELVATQVRSILEYCGLSSSSRSALDLHKYCFGIGGCGCSRKPACVAFREREELSELRDFRR